MNDINNAKYFIDWWWLPCHRTTFYWIWIITICMMIAHHFLNLSVNASLHSPEIIQDIRKRQDTFWELAPTSILRNKKITTENLYEILRKALSFFMMMAALRVQIWIDLLLKKVLHIFLCINIDHLSKCTGLKNKFWRNLLCKFRPHFYCVFLVLRKIFISLSKNEIEKLYDKTKNMQLLHHIQISHVYDIYKKSCCRKKVIFDFFAR